MIFGLRRVDFPYHAAKELYRRISVTPMNMPVKIMTGFDVKGDIRSTQRSAILPSGNTSLVQRSAVLLMVWLRGILMDQLDPNADEHNI